MSDATNATPKKAPRPKVREWQPKFLDGLRESGTVAGACELAGIARSTAYRRREKVPSFAALWDEVLEDVADDLEQEAIRRAKEGSVALLIFLLKGLKPDKYTERKQVSGPNGGPIETKVTGVQIYVPDNGRD